ncbi:MAG: hypothetical protein M3198_06400 [Actinomycetota bacterium]|nr:hypothetical protein [Actinomycetota bacterium]
MRRFATIAVIAVLAVAAVPTLASAGKNKGTWTYIDTTPDPTVVENPASAHCSGGLVPAAPVDVNVHTFKAKKKGTLTLTAHNALDWAVEVHDSKGANIGGTDGASPVDPENLSVSLRKGTYKVIYCNFAGEPEITVDYRFK